MVDNKDNDLDALETAVPAMLEEEHQQAPQAVELGPSAEGEAILEAPQDEPPVSAAVPAPIPEVSQEGEAVSEDDNDALKEKADKENEAPLEVDAEDNEPVLIELSEAQEIALEKIDTHALWVIKRLCAKGHKAYLAGGCVRDLLLDRTPKDYDVATSATPQEVKSAFRNCRLVGRRFLLAHVFFPGGKNIETATFRANPLEQMEEEPEDLLLRRDNVFGSEEEDARRRDLTINGLFYDPLTGQVIDHVNAHADLKAKLVRTIGDPFVRFQEDPVRIVRAIKFATRLGFDIEENTLNAMREHAPDLEKCAPARLLEEFNRLLQSGHASAAFSMCHELGVLSSLLPEYHALMAHDMEDLEAVEAELFAVTDSPEESTTETSEEVSTDAAEGEDNEDEGADDDGADSDSEDPRVELDDGLMVVSLDDEGTVDGASDDDDDDDDDDEEEEDDEGSDAAPITPSSVEESVADKEEETEREPSSEVPDKDEEGATADDSDAVNDADVANDNAAPAEAQVVPELPPVRTPDERVARLARLMNSLDLIKERDADVPSEVALATFLLPAWEALIAKGLDGEKWWDQISYVWGRRLRMTRRDRERVAILLPGLAQMQPESRFGNEARQLTRRGWFKELLMLYTLSLHAEGKDLSEIAAWKVIADDQGRGYKQYKMGERPRYRRNRRRRYTGGRRGGGGRNQGGGGGSGGRRYNSRRRRA